MIKSVSTTILRGDKVGILGRNGAGKSTLLKGILGELPLLAGNRRLGTNLQIAYFDQNRQQLDPEKTAEENVGQGRTTISINGSNRHIIGYLQDFLFSPEQIRTPIRYFSGGQRNRLLLAKLFTLPANLLVLDEPTNDLDSETLELLEEKLVEYNGTVIVVSHDRDFLTMSFRALWSSKKIGLRNTMVDTATGCDNARTRLPMEPELPQVPNRRRRRPPRSRKAQRWRRLLPRS